MTNTPVYLDYQATTPIDPKVRESMDPFLDSRFGNPHSSDHSFGWEAAHAVKNARASIAALINADDDEIVFTSGATESCNLALRGIAYQSHSPIRNRIVTLTTEHPAVFETVLDLRQSGFETIILPVDADGLLNLDQLERVLDERTLIVSVMAANNEIGVLQPIEEIAARCRAVGAIIHTDATQAIGRIPVDVENWDIDLLTLSSHKVYGPKGIGALFVREGVTLKPIITGGHQERGLRGGTLAPALVVGFGVACQVASERQVEDRAKMESLTCRLHTALLKAHPAMRLFGHAEKRLPGSLNVGFPGLPADEVIRNVSDYVAVSSGSACTSAILEPSRVLLALGLDSDTAASGIRISLGRFTTDQDVNRAITILSRIAAHARPDLGT